jgi:hypothetical protein
VPHATEDAPSYRSHFQPRTRTGRVAVALFIGLFLFAEPPLVFALANRIEPWLLGMPFLYVYLLAVYVALIGVLVWARRRGL